MPKEFKRYQTENGNKYIRYYTPEGENSAFAQHHGANRRAIESRASLVEFIKECERLALRPEKELEQLREEDSKYIGIINSKERNALYKEAIYEMAQHRR